MKTVGSAEAPEEWSGPTAPRVAPASATGQVVGREARGDLLAALGRSRARVADGLDGVSDDRDVAYPTAPDAAYLAREAARNADLRAAFGPLRDDFEETFEVTAAGRRVGVTRRIAELPTGDAVQDRDLAPPKVVTRDDASVPYAGRFAPAAPKVRVVVAPTAQAGATSTTVCAEAVAPSPLQETSQRRR